MNRQTVTIAIAALLAYSVQAFGFSVDEASNGELSGIPQVPTSLSLELGANTLVASAGTGGSNVDFDIFTFSVAANTALTAIFLDGYSQPNGVSFIGVQTGTTWTAGTGGGITGSALAGWALFGIDNIGENLLPTMAITNLNNEGASGFSLPLGAGDYVFLIQDTGSPINYALTFNASAVPLPASLPLLAMAILGLFRARRKSLVVAAKRY